MGSPITSRVFIVGLAQFLHVDNLTRNIGPERYTLEFSSATDAVYVRLMSTHRFMLFLGLAFSCVTGTPYLFTGCRSVEKEQLVSKPVFFPPPPEVPRLQFLTSFSGPEVFGKQPTSGFERFVLGKPKTIEGIIAPYGTAIFEGKLYVCDVGSKTVAVFDLRNRTYGRLTNDSRLLKPVNIFIDENGWKYITDPAAGLVFVFDRDDDLVCSLGNQLKIIPVDVAVRGTLCYVTDCASNRIVVLNKVTGEELMRVGLKRRARIRAQPESELPPGEFSLISNLAFDQKGNMYVTDKAGARITQFDTSGVFRRTIGRLGDNIDEFVRPKGIAIDKDHRIWVVDSATEVAKIYNEQGQLLLFFGLRGNKPGMMNIPATIVIDYDNVDFFRHYAVKGADIEFLVLVSNQFGPHKISVYAFGTFPRAE